MKKILISLAIIVAVAAIVVGGTWAYFSNSAISEGNTFSTGNADLKIRNGTDQSWADSYGGAAWTNLYPGWSNSYNVYLKNNSASPITLKVFPNIITTAGDWELLDNVRLQFLYGDGTPVNNCGKATLRWWRDNPDAFDIGDLTQEQERGPWVVSFDIPTSADNTIAGKTITFDLNFNGIQQP